jgi:hypothetical protein
MFGGAQLLGSTERRIVLQTHRGREVENLIEVEPGEPERRKYQLLLRKYGRNWRQRKPATGVYNCAGLVWASRRTAILADDAWAIILADDGYRKLGPREAPLPGDLVIYRDSDSKIGFLHVGMILTLEPGIAPSSPLIPLVLSKWDSTSGEVVHLCHDVPFDPRVFSLVTEFWTDRPVGSSEGGT